MLLLGLWFTGCSRPIAYGVLLWPEEESALNGGQVVTIYTESEVFDHYEVDQEGTVIERWRIRLFDTRALAETFSEQFASYGDVYGRADRSALPVRMENDRSSDLLYRLRKGEIVKILGRDEEQSDEAGFIGYWYRVLTVSGVEGWAFGYYLSVFDIGDGRPIATVDIDEQIYRFLNGVWRPAYFRTMMTSGKIDLRRFQPGYGLFPSPLEKRIALQLPDSEIEFRYERLTPISADRLLIEAEPPLSVQLISDDEIEISYMVGVDTIEQRLYSIDADVATIANRERARREANYVDLLSRGATFISSDWGQLELMRGKRFRWVGYALHLSDLIPEDAGELGRIELELAISDRLVERYDGAISLYFDQQPLLPVHLLFRYRTAGIELQPVMASDLDMDFIVMSLSSDRVLGFDYR